MKCAICRTGSTSPGTTTVTLQKGNTTVVIKEVPADICDNCGEYYLSEEVTARVHRLSRPAVEQGAEVELLPYEGPGQTVRNSAGERAHDESGCDVRPYHAQVLPADRGLKQLERAIERVLERREREAGERGETQREGGIGDPLESGQDAGKTITD